MTQTHTIAVGIEKDTFFVLTGGPGSGKTSIIDALIGRGVFCVSEAARNIIKEQLRIGGSAVPWSDARTFRESHTNLPANLPFGRYPAEQRPAILNTAARTERSVQ